MLISISLAVSKMWSSSPQESIRQTSLNRYLGRRASAEDRVLGGREEPVISLARLYFPFVSFAKQGKYDLKISGTGSPLAPTNERLSLREFLRVL